MFLGFAVFVAPDTPAGLEAPVVPSVFWRTAKTVKSLRTLETVVILVTLQIVSSCSADHHTWNTDSFAFPETLVCDLAYIDSLDI